MKISIDAVRKNVNSGDEPIPEEWFSKAQAIAKEFYGLAKGLYLVELLKIMFASTSENQQEVAVLEFQIVFNPGGRHIKEEEVSIQIIKWQMGTSEIRFDFENTKSQFYQGPCQKIILNGDGDKDIALGLLIVVMAVISHRGLENIKTAAILEERAESIRAELKNILPQLPKIAAKG